MEKLPIQQPLSRRENEIFLHLMNRMRSKDIADMLGISKHTVDTHRRKILKKTQCKNTSALLVLYFEEKKKENKL
ncbi:MAG: helix-turn-helix transcriptional regulator [Candidatus Kuenenia stuttgartiensis]|nr:helix-turn-helix transcriptional regulator [Candidatus Kuenenia stuttgartiensis]MCZ2443453.1 helix-turn-helix transcriptional regulator [Flavobacteriales bacterium]